MLVLICERRILLFLVIQRLTHKQQDYDCGQKTFEPVTFVAARPSLRGETEPGLLLLRVERFGHLQMLRLYRSETGASAPPRHPYRPAATEDRLANLLKFRVRGGVIGGHALGELLHLWRTG
jgi:hypothetical protein